MEGELSLRRFSPEVMLQDPNIRSAASLLPPIALFHGTADYSIPCDARLESSLRSKKIRFHLSAVNKKTKWIQNFCCKALVT